MNSQLTLSKDKKLCMKYYGQFLISGINTIYRFLIILLTFFATMEVYELCIVDLTLENTITLGAVFATIGSAIVSVVSLFCGEQFNQFNANIKILQNQLIQKDDWERWPFVKRISRSKTPTGEYEYQILKNPHIIFKGPSWEKKIFLPSSKTDFKELPVYRTFYALKRNRALYRKLLTMYSDPNVVKEILLWDCLTDAYKNITLYKAGGILIWFGWGLVANSFIFSFFYSYFI